MRFTRRSDPGRPAEQQQAAIPPAVRSFRVVFSVLYAESEGFLECLVRNFLMFTGPDCLLVVNLPGGSALSCPAARGSDRVALMTGGFGRAKLGHTLLAAHVEALGHAATLCEFEFFCPLASNSLFFRRFDLAATLATMALPDMPVRLDALPDHWWWKNAVEDGRLVPFLRERWALDVACSYQIEGHFASRADWLEVGRRLGDMLADPGMVSPALPFPVEEILPATVFLNHGPARHTRICHLFWARGPAAPMTVADVIEQRMTMPPEICLAKWFDRDPASPGTAVVTRSWSGLLPAGPGERQETAGDRLAMRLVLEGLAAAFRAQEAFEPITRNWWPEGEAAEQPRIASRHVLPRGYSHLVLDETAETELGERAALLFTEDLAAELEIGIRISQAETTRIAVDTVTLGPGPGPGPEQAGADAGTSSLAGYLFLAPQRPAGITVIRLVLGAVHGVQPADVVGRLIIRYAHGHPQLALQHREEVAGGVAYYFMLGQLDCSQGFWLGLPFFSDSRLEMTVAVL